MPLWSLLLILLVPSTLPQALRQALRQALALTRPGQAVARPA